jgi:hypothetical protein
MIPDYSGLNAQSRPLAPLPDEPERAVRFVPRPAADWRTGDPATGMARAPGAAHAARARRGTADCLRPVAQSVDVSGMVAAGWFPARKSTIDRQANAAGERAVK